MVYIGFENKHYIPNNQSQLTQDIIKVSKVAKKLPNQEVVQQILSTSAQAPTWYISLVHLLATQHLSSTRGYSLPLPEKTTPPPSSTTCLLVPHQLWPASSLAGPQQSKTSTSRDTKHKHHNNSSESQHHNNSSESQKVRNQAGSSDEYSVL
jgi:hypothetical protein